MSRVRTQEAPCAQLEVKKMETARKVQGWQQLHEQLRGIARRRAALDAEEARCLREAHETKLWRRLGYAHMNEYLERELGYAPQVGVERLRIALALGTLPQIEASLNDGWLSYSAVRELTRVATAETEQDWLNKALGKNLREIEVMVAGRKRGDRPEDPKNPDLVKRMLRLELTPAAFALFRQAQSAMAEEHGGHLDDSALIEVLCRRALEGTGNTDRPPYQIAITQCEWCGRGWQNGAGRQVDVGRDVVERARCDAELIGSIDADEPERLRTTVTPRVRRHVLARDSYRCTVPGCRAARNLDLHHIEYRSEGGCNEMWNLTTVCSAHHKCLHEGLLIIQGKAPHSLEFVWTNAPAIPVDRGVDPPPQLASSSPVADPAQPHAGAGRGIDAVRQAARSSAVADTGQPPVNISPGVDVTRQTRPNATASERSTGADSNVERAERDEVDDRVNAATIDHDARAALVTAGYRSREALAAVEKARPHVGPSATLEQVIREALRQCPLVVRLPHLPAPRSPSW
jgi:hypothetical protein